MNGSCSFNTKSAVTPNLKQAGRRSRNHTVKQPTATTENTQRKRNAADWCLSHRQANDGRVTNPYMSHAIPSSSETSKVLVRVGTCKIPGLLIPPAVCERCSRTPSPLLRRHWRTLRRMSTIQFYDPSDCKNSTGHTNIRITLTIPALRLQHRVLRKTKTQRIPGGVNRASHCRASNSFPSTRKCDVVP